MEKKQITVYSSEESQLLQEPTPKFSIFKQLPKGWKFGAICCAIATSLVFLFNFGITIWMLSRINNSEDGAIVLFNGSCQKVNRFNLISHIFINILSTILLSSSNYCMQILSAPTRSALDKAHAKRKWLDIGVVSLRNLRRISNKRRALWSLLALSSLPIHLFFNSVVFTSISVNEYDAISVTKAFITSPPTSNFTSRNKFMITEAQYLRNLTAAGKLEELDLRSCLDAYASKLQTSRGRVLVVTSSSNESYVGDSNSNYVDSWFYSWICGDDFANGKSCSLHLDTYRRNISSWHPFEQNVEYCLSERLEENCKLNTSLPIAILVTVLNVIKVVAMVLLVFWVNEEPILTIGGCDCFVSGTQRSEC